MNKNNRIKELREFHNLTQEQLGKIIDVEKSTISKYEKGALDLNSNNIALLCDYFNVTSDYLLGFNEKQNNNSLMEKFGVDADDIEEIVEGMHKNPQIKVLFSMGSKLTKGELEKILKIIEVMHSEEDNSNNEEQEDFPDD